MSGDDDLLFFQEESGEEKHRSSKDSWKVLIVDDEEEVHLMTRIALKGLQFEGKGLSFFSAYSEEEAKEVIAENGDLALTLLDVVMESDDSGLKVVGHIREVLKNPFVRIIMRTGQPGVAPEREIILAYDINDYKEKTELTAHKLITCVISCLRSYRDISALAEKDAQLLEYSQGLERLVERRTAELAKANESLQVELKERKRAEEEMRKARDVAQKATQLKDQFVSIVAHDLRAPFSSIKGLLEILREDEEDTLSGEQKDLIDRVLDSSTNMLKLINRLLDTGRFAMGKVDLSLTSVGSRDVVEEAIKNLEPVAREKKITLVNEVENQAIRVDWALFGEVLQNLISNAIKFSYPGSHIEIFSPGDREAVIAIKDFGVGIGEKERENLFRHEVKTSTVGTSGEKGTGLGLPYCKDIIDEHKGRLTLESERGKGSVFYVDIPNG